MQNLTETEIDTVTALKRGDEKGCKYVIAQYHPALMRLACAVAGPDAAEDVVREVWISVSRDIKDFAWQAGLKTSLYRIVVNIAMGRSYKTDKKALQLETELGPAWKLNDMGRFNSKGHWQHPPLSWQAENTENLLQPEQLLGVLQEAVTKLPPMQQTVILLYDIERVAMADICNILAVSLSNVRVLLHRARLKLRDAVEEYVGWES